MTRCLAVFAMLAAAFAPAAAEPCPPRAQLDGEEVAVERVAEELRRLGVEVVEHRELGEGRDRESCTVVRAYVARLDTGGIAVAIRGERTSEGRVVSDEVFAAAWIDSWTRDDIDRALWAAPPPIATPSVAPPPAPAAVRKPSRVAVPRISIVAPHDVAPRAPRRSRWENVALAATYEQAWTDDGAAWSGTSVSACVRVGSFCLGGRARLALDPARAHKATAVERNDAVALATASHPIAIGRMSIAPELGVGIGRIATTRVDEICSQSPAAPPPNCELMMPDCAMVPEPTTMCEPTMTNPGGSDPQLHVGDDLRVATYAPRIALAVRVAVPLFEHVWLDGLAGVTYAPLGHVEDFAAGPTETMVIPELVSLPGEPTSAYVLGIGLRVGAR